LEQRIVDKQNSLSQTYRAAHQSEAELTAQRRQKEVLVADSQWALDDAQRRWAAAERQQQDLTLRLQETNEKRSAALRATEEVRGATTRAELRQVELAKEEAALRAKLNDTAASIREKNIGSQAEEQFTGTLRNRLEQRVAELEEENAVSAERLRRLEQQFAAQQAVWSANEDALQTEAESATKLLHGVSTRLALLEQELAGLEAEGERLRRARHDRADQLAAQRAADGDREIERIRREGEAREAELRREQAEALSILRAELDETVALVERKTRARDEQQRVVDGLRTQLAQLQSDAEARSTRQAECEALERDVAQQQEDLAATLRDIEAAKADIASWEEERARLRAVSRALSGKVADEKRLRAIVAELATEVHEAETQHEAEVAALERQEAEQKAQLDDVRRQLNRANDDIDRVSADASVELGMLNRDIAALRQSVVEKENTLNSLIAENAGKQASIAQLEEEKRRLEREQIARKAAAAQATKAALAELGSF
jgi:chromosome segregation ATPase